MKIFLSALVAIALLSGCGTTPELVSRDTTPAPEYINVLPSGYTSFEPGQRVAVNVICDETALRIMYSATQDADGGQGKFNEMVNAGHCQGMSAIPVTLGSRIWVATASDGRVLAAYRVGDGVYVFLTATTTVPGTSL